MGGSDIGGLLRRYLSLACPSAGLTSGSTCICGSSTKGLGSLPWMYTPVWHIAGRVDGHLTVVDKEREAENVASITASPRLNDDHDPMQKVANTVTSSSGLSRRHCRDRYKVKLLDRDGFSRLSTLQCWLCRNSRPRCTSFRR